MAKAIIRRIAGALEGIPGVEAVTLGGSRVTGMAMAALRGLAAEVEGLL